MGGQVDKLLVLREYVVFVLFYTSSWSVHSLTFRSLCVSFLLHLFICAICESLYKQIVHWSTCYNFLTDDTDIQI